MAETDLRPTVERLRPRIGLRAITPSLLGLRFVEVDGGLVLADEGDVAVRLVDDGEGGLVLNDEATSGLTILATPTDIGVY